MLDVSQIQRIVEAALMAADGPLTTANLTALFAPGELDEEAGSRQVRDAIKALQSATEGRGVELKQVASGYRYQVRQDLSIWVSRLWDEKPPRYSRALLETLALIAYKQPVTRGDIEQIRGVSVSQTIMRTLLEREWIKVVGQKDVPGRPSLYATTRSFLDYFNLRTLEELPPLPEIRELIEPALVEEQAAPAQSAAEEATADDPHADGNVAEITVSGIPVAEQEPSTAAAATPDAPAAAPGSGIAEVVPLHRERQ